MIIQYHIEQLSRLIQDIYDITGISISILDAQQTVLANCSNKQDFCSLLQSLPGEKQLCRACDHSILSKCNHNNRLESHICRTSLCDCAMPIMKHDTLVGYIIMGRVRSADSCAALTYSPQADEATEAQLRALYQQIPYMSQKQLQALYNLLPSVLFNNAIQVIYDPFINAAVDYIQSHLQENISIHILCAELHVSANYLYHVFRTNFDCTVNEYITEQRIKVAKNLLENTDDSICNVAEKVGIHNYTYFCKLFKKKTGFTPMAYRKQF